MSEPHVRRRQGIPRRSRPVQASLIAIGQEIAAFSTTSPATPESEGESYRVVLAAWPLRWRERWGRRANALEDLGLSWRSAELRAFVEVGDERRRKAEESREISGELARRN